MKDQLFDLMCEHLTKTCPSCSTCTQACNNCASASTSACVPGGTGMAPGVTQVLAAQTLKIASINGLGEDNKLETELEDEIRWEERHPPREVIGRARRKCEEILHSKKMMLVIIILNIVDCLLVVGELTLDFNQVTNQLVSMEDHTKEFMRKLRIQNPALADLANVNEDNLTVLFDRFLRSYIIWNPSRYTGHDLAADCVAIQAAYNASSGTATGTLSSLLSFVAAITRRPLRMEPMAHEHLNLEQMAHKLHYCSISILSFLLVETILKIVSVGRRFLRKKMEMFDAVVVAISFVLDLVFVQGLTASNMRTFVVILSFLLPWRVLRVLNSLIVALMHQNRFHLKVLYKQKRKITTQCQEATDNVQRLEKQVKVLKSLCTERGVHDWEINKAIAQTIKPSAEGGLKTLGTLIFKAAESFATLTVPKVNNCTSTTNTPTRPGGSGILGTGRPHSLPYTISCNGDVHHNHHHHSAPNGLTRLMGQDLQMADKTSTNSDCSAKLTPTGHKSRANGKASGKGVQIGVPADKTQARGASSKVVQSATDSPGVIRFSDECIEQVGSNGSGVQDPSHSEDCVEDVQAETDPGSEAVEDDVLKEDDRLQDDPDKSTRQDSVDSVESSRPTRFYLSSDESVETASMEDIADSSDKDGVFTRL